jgi:phosphoribosyl 1,2-cyclic phosphodiesterase
MSGLDAGVGDGIHDGLEILSFGSGSNGNAYLVRHGRSTVLIDAGIPIRRLRQLLSEAGVDEGEIEAVLVSHEHVDHARALGSLLRGRPCPVYATAGTIAALSANIRVCWVDATEEMSFSVGTIAVTPVPVSHDARQPVAFYFEAGTTSVGILTDLGAPNSIVADVARSSDLLVIESNYDEQMLRRGSYPAHLKRRIRSDLGHLGNRDCAEFVARNLTNRTGTVWLAHLSENNNDPAIAVRETREALRGIGLMPEIRALPRYSASPVRWRSVDARGPSYQATMPF